MPAPSRNTGDRKGGPGGGHGGRGGGRRNDRRSEPKEYQDATLSIDRVTRVVKGGRRMRFRAVVVIGNKKGKVGLGTGKSAEVQGAIQKATRAARRAMVIVPIKNGTIPHDVNIKHKAARLRLIPAAPGTGIIAGGALRVILDLAGVQNVLSKRFGTKNKLVNAQAAMMALAKLKGTSKPGTVEEVAEVKDEAPAADAEKKEA